jgi:hypothetical protein
LRLASSSSMRADPAMARVASQSGPLIRSSTDVRVRNDTSPGEARSRNSVRRYAAMYDSSRFSVNPATRCEVPALMDNAAR